MRTTIGKRYPPIAQAPPPSYLLPKAQKPPPSFHLPPSRHYQKVEGGEAFGLPSEGGGGAFGLPLEGGKGGELLGFHQKVEGGGLLGKRIWKDLEIFIRNSKDFRMI